MTLKPTLSGFGITFGGRFPAYTTVNPAVNQRPATVGCGGCPPVGSKHSVAASR
jgi:hypothetical protein